MTLAIYDFEDFASLGIDNQYMLLVIGHYKLAFAAG